MIKVIYFYSKCQLISGFLAPLLGAEKKDKQYCIQILYNHTLNIDTSIYVTYVCYVIRYRCEIKDKDINIYFTTGIQNEDLKDI